jgi:two-component system KDP operon response regulator KdpE
MSRILLVEDEPGMRKVLRDAFERDEHQVETAVDGRDALDRLQRRSFDLIVTDLNMPVLGGHELVQEVRKTSPVPILVLTVRRDESEKVALLDSGADDFVTKPFGVEELLARARALLRRSEAGRDVPLSRWGDAAVDFENRRVFKADREIHLTPTEFSLLKTFLSKPDAVWTHLQLRAAVWGRTAGVTNDTLRVHVGGLRRKLEDDPNQPRWFRTEPWVGYRFTPGG